MDKSDKSRLAENEVIFRDANTNMAGFIEESSGGINIKTKLPFYCECSSKGCKERIKLTPKEYKSCHKNKRRFIAKAGHEIAEIEKIVSEHEGYNVIEKFGNPPSVDEIDLALKTIALS